VSMGSWLGKRYCGGRGVAWYSAPSRILQKKGCKGVPRTLGRRCHKTRWGLAAISHLRPIVQWVVDISWSVGPSGVLLGLNHVPVGTCQGVGSHCWGVFIGCQLAGQQCDAALLQLSSCLVAVSSDTVSVVCV